MVFITSFFFFLVIPSLRPLFNNNDVIGCGFDFTRRSIFYTLNGELLGTAFTDVEEDVLLPIIGFHGNAVNQSVSINFGVEPFMYEGPEVQINVKCLSEREARRQRNLAKAAISESSSVDIPPVVEIDRVPSGSTNENSSIEAYEEQFIQLRYRMESLSRTMRELRSIRKYCRGLLRFLLALVCENDSTLPILNDATDKMVLRPSILTKGRSAFGTPKFETYGDGALLTQDICSFFVDELTRSASYFVSNSQSAGYLFSRDDESSPIRSGTEYYEANVAMNDKSFRALDFFDVEGASYEILLGMRAIVILSRQAKSNICRAESVGLLISLLEFGSTRLRDLAAPLLCYILPDMLPEDVESTLSTTQLTRALVDTLNHESASSDRRNRKLPDTVIKVLFKSVKQIVLLPYSNLPLQLHGEGAVIMHNVFANALIIHHLLDTISYSEIVSRFLTEALRQVDNYIGKAHCGISDGSVMEAYASATAAGIVMSGMTSKYCRGVKVTTAGGKGTILSYDYALRTFSVLLSSAFKSMYNIVQIPEKDVFLSYRVVSTDISALSQPLLPQLISTFKRVLVKMKSAKNLSRFHEINKMFWRLTSCLSQAISCMICSRQDGVTDAILYADFLPEVVAVSLMDSGLEHFTSFEEAQDMWHTCLARSLEVCRRHETESMDSRTTANEVQAHSHEMETPSQQHEPNDSEEDSSNCDLTAAHALSVETGVAIEECSQLLAYFMNNIEQTRSYLLNAAASSKQSEQPPCGSHGAEALLASILLQAPDRTIQRSSYIQMEFGGYADAYESLSWASSAGLLVLESGSDSSSIEDGRVGQIEPSVVSSSDVPFTYFYEARGVHLNELVKRSSLRFMRSFYGCRSSEELSDFLMILDRALSIIHLREVIMALLYDCNINIVTDAPRLEDWVRLIKLSSVSGRKEKVRSNSAMCEALVKAARANLHTSTDAAAGSLDDRIMRLLMSDLLDNLHRLMKPEKLKVQSQTFRSAHPFIDNHVTWGEIMVSPGALGAIISFDPQSCTPSRLARLMLYAAKEDMESENPIHSFWGKSGSRNYFKAFYAPNVSRLFYKFVSEQGSNKPEILVVYDDAKIKVNNDTKVCKGIPVVVRASTGEDDSLSNFFDAQLHRDDDPSLVVADCEFITSGKWYFEIQLEGLMREDSTDNPDNVRVGLIDTTYEQSSRSSSDSGAYMLNLIGNFSSDTEQVSRCSLQLHDTVGVKFRIEDAVLEIRFLVNGTEAYSHSCSIRGTGVKPAFFIGGSASLTYNFGHQPFNFPPETIYSPMHCRPADVDVADSFGYEFSVEPVNTVPYQIAREFDLVFTLKGNENSSSIHIWRPKVSTGYAHVGDIATTSKVIPLGGLTVRKDMCKAPIEYKLAFLCTKTSIAIWRPIPPEGYVSLGDVFYYSADQTPSTDLTVCVPSWATKPCSLGARAYYNKSNKDSKTYSMSLWFLNGGSGLFRGSRTLDSSGIDASVLCSMVADTESEINGEWFTERDVLGKPSLTWSCAILDFLMDETVGSERIISDPTLFSTLVDYISNSNRPNPLKLVPYVIRYIRLAAMQSTPIDIQRLRPHCKSIAHSMAGKSSELKKSVGHQMLADLAIECERYRLLQTSSTQHETFQYRDEITRELKSNALMLDSLSITKVLNRDSMLTKIRSVLSFFNSIQNTSRNNFVAPELLCKVWFDGLSLTFLEQSCHPHSLEKFQKSITVPGAEKYAVTLDRRSSLLEGCSLKVSGGGSIFYFRGGEEADTFTKPIVFSSSTLEICFECSDETDAPGCIEHWGWGVLIDAIGTNSYETAKVRVKLRDVDGISTLTPLLSGQNDGLNDHNVLSGGTQDANTGADNDGMTPDFQRRNELKTVQLEITNELLEKAAEIGRLVESNEIHLPFNAEKSIEVRGNFGSQNYLDDNNFYVLSFIYISGEEQKTVRTALKPDLFFEHKINECSSITYTVHAVNEGKLKEIFASTHNVADGTALSQRDSPIDVTAHVDIQHSSWTCGKNFIFYTLCNRRSTLVAVCTFMNSSSITECEMCGNVAQADGEPPREIQVSWFCRSCTLINQGNITRCAACDTERDATTMQNPSSESDSDTESGSSTSQPQLVHTSEVSSRPRARESILRAMLGGVLRARESTAFTVEGTADVDKSDSVVITFRGTYSVEQRFEIRLERAIHERRIVPAVLKEMMRQWTPQLDNVLLEHINSLSITSEEQVMTRVTLPKQIFNLYHGIGMDSFTVLDVCCRAQVFRAFNALIKDLLPCLNLMNNDPMSLGALVRKYNRYIFLCVKQPILDAALEESQVNGGAGLPATLVLSNFKSIASKEKPDPEPIKCMNCFVQAFLQLQKKEAKVFKHIFSGDRVFQINFDGESGIDAGGIFREGMSRMIEDLFCEQFSLLSLCPNGKHSVHMNTEKFLPNPVHRGPIEILMFEFIGRLMGTSLRAKLCLPFEFPSIIWKRLAGDEVNDDDLLAIDAISFRQITDIMNCEKDGITDDDMFEEKFGSHFFTVLGSDGQEHELIPDGRDKVVRFTDRKDYGCKAISFRLHEFDIQVAAIKRGLEDVVPINLLQLFSWQQLEILVAGSPEFDINLWKSKTDSEQISSKVSQLFWKVMESFTPKEQSGFVRFAWGRSRLPPERQWTTRMRLTNADRAPLPVSHTCFFSVELPSYETEAEMRRGLLTAIHFGVGGILNG